MRSRTNQLLSLALLVVLLVLSFVPIVMMLSMALRPSISILADFWGWPWPPHFANFGTALFKLIGPTFNSLFVGVVAVAGILAVSTLSGYVFARLEFPGRRLLFLLILALMMVPGMLLLTPNFVLAMQLGLQDSYWGLWLFYIASGQIFGIFLVRNFFAALPEAMFESARLDGATELQCLRHIAVPLSRPILVTISIMTFLGLYNDLIWPMLLINDPSRETLMVALTHFSPVDPKLAHRSDLGVQAAGYVFASVPLLIVLWFGMKSYIQGITSGAIKS